MRVALLTTDARECARDYKRENPTFGTAPEALLQGFAQLPELEIHVVSCARAPMKSPEKLAPNIFFHGLHVPKIGWRRTLFLGCIMACRKVLRRIRPDIVHGQGTEEDCAISAVFSGFPNLLTIHGNMRLIAKATGARFPSFPWFSAQLETFTVPRSLGVVCITRYTRDAMSGLARHSWVLPNAVDSTFFGVNPDPPTHAPPRILCVGLVCPRKNQNTFIRALDPLAKQMKFELLFLGQASAGRAYDDEFLGLVKARPWCSHLGFADRDKLREHFSKASALALPSLEDNCPMAVLEAMAAEVPVVAARVGGVPELIEENQTGIFCDPLDPGSMMSAIQRMLSNRPAAARMATNARTRALERFHPRIIARKHLEIYREVLSNR